MRDFQNEFEQNRCSTSIRVYRGQIVSINELDELKSSIGSLISFPMCFRASTDRKLTMNSLENYAFRNDEEKLLFEIDGKPSKTTDNDFVFEFASIFQLKSITREQPGLSIVRLTSIDEEFRPSNRFQLDVDRSSNLSFGNFLYQIGKFSLAEEFFRQILKNLTETNLDGRLRCLHALGLITLAKDDFLESLRFHDESLKLCGVDDPRAAEIYHCLGCVEQKRNDFARALEFYQKALTIWTNAFGDDFFPLGDVFNNIACIYETQDDPTKALEFHKKSLKIRENKNPVDRRALSMSYNNMANIYLSMNDFDNALKYYRTALDLKMENLPSDHLLIGSTLANLGFVYEQKQNFVEALNFYQKAMIILRANLSSTCFQIQQTDEDIRRMAQLLQSVKGLTLV